MCRLLEVGGSGYYDWRKRKPSKRKKKHAMLKEKIIQFHDESKRISGYRKIHEDILDYTDLKCDKEVIRLLMIQLGLCSRVFRKFKTTTDSNHKLPVAPNILNRNFESLAPNKKWVTDITYIQTLEGWFFLAVVLDLFSNKVVGWATSVNIDEALVVFALKDAIEKRKPGLGLLHHSDRGVQYASLGYQKLLDTMGMTCSMSRKANCWDNAKAENFFQKLKIEWVCGQIYRTRKAARTAIFEYIEIFYNRKRRHASNGYLSPIEFENQAARKAA